MDRAGPGETGGQECPLRRGREKQALGVAGGAHSGRSASTKLLWHRRLWSASGNKRRPAAERNELRAWPGGGRWVDHSSSRAEASAEATGTHEPDQV